MKVFDATEKRKSGKAEKRGKAALYSSDEKSPSFSGEMSRRSTNPCAHCGYADYRHLARHMRDRPAYCLIAEKDADIAKLKHMVDDRDEQVSVLKEDLRDARVRLEISMSEDSTATHAATAAPHNAVTAAPHSAVTAASP